jgi:hypothetical protein
MLWEETAGDESLINVPGSVGLILYDVVEALRLDPDQQIAVLGERLAGDVSEYIERGMVATLPDFVPETIKVAEDQSV